MTESDRPTLSGAALETARLRFLAVIGEIHTLAGLQIMRSLARVWLDPQTQAYHDVDRALAVREARIRIEVDVDDVAESPLLPVSTLERRRRPPPPLGEAGYGRRDAARKEAQRVRQRNLTALAQSVATLAETWLALRDFRGELARAPVTLYPGLRSPRPGATP